jgi:phospholipase/carboxylesterase
MQIELLPALEWCKADKPDASLILMHGLGANGEDLVPLADQLVLASALRMRFILPHAPAMQVTVNEGAMMPAWYDIESLDSSDREDEAGMHASRDKIVQLIARENQRGIPSSRIVLAGFSQGGVMALFTGLCHAERLAGIAALSSYLPLVLQWMALSPKYPGLPIFMGHGCYDPFIPLALAKTSKDLLGAHGYAVEWHEYGAQHHLCPQEIQDLSHWLNAVLPVP